MKSLQLIGLLGCFVLMGIYGCSKDASTTRQVDVPDLKTPAASSKGKLRPIDIALFDAVRYDDVKRAQQLIKQGAEVNVVRKPWNMTPLLQATQKDADIAKLLIDAGADVNAADRDGATVLMKAARADNIDVVRHVLATGKVDLDARDKFGETALVYAIVLGRTEIVGRLIAKGSDVNIVRYNGETPLLVAIRNQGYAKDYAVNKLMRHESGKGHDNLHEPTYITKDQLIKERKEIVALMEHAGAKSMTVEVDATLHKSHH